MLKISDKNCCRAMQAILGVTAIIVLITFRDYGVTWDEELQSQYGLAVVDYYASLFADHRFDQIFNLFLYGGMFDGLASVIDSYTPFSVYETRHLVNAGFGILGLWGTWRLGRLIGGGMAGLAALLLLLLTPMYYGHMFNNPKDIPFAAGVVWTLYYMSKALTDLPRIRRKTLVMAGIAFGLTLGIRVGGIMMMLFWLIALKWNAAAPVLKLKPWWKWFIPVRKTLPSWRKFLAAYWRIGWRLVLPSSIIAYFVMLACWPWAQQSPIMNPLHAFNEFRHFPQDVEILLDGTIYLSTELPRSYVPLYFAVQLPEMLLFLLGSTILLLPRILSDLKPSQRQAFALTGMTAFLPILYAVAGHPALYDAVRHFLFTVPLMCIIGAQSAVTMLRWAMEQFDHKRSHKLIATGLLAAFGIAALSQIGLMIALHPYEYIFVNAFAGGVPGAFGHYELDYWGSSFKEAAEEIEDFVDDEGGVPPGKIYRIAICGPWDSAMIYLPPDYEAVEADQPAEFFLSTTRWMCQNMRPGREIIRITRLGVPLSVVKDLREQKKP